jgi:hypothetical protein
MHGLLLPLPPTPHKFMSHSLIIKSKKGKAIPLQARTDPEGSRRISLPDFKTIGI